MPPPLIHVALDPEEYDRRFPSPARRYRALRAVARMFLLSVAFVGAIAAGAFGARWIDDLGGIDAVMSRFEPRAARPEVERPFARAPAGSELPYDGAAPAVTAPPPSAKTIETRSGREEPSSSGGGNGQSAEATDSPNSARALKPPKPAPPKAAKTVEQSAKPAAPKAARKESSAQQKIARNREISRIQQQASEELKKKTRKRRSTGIEAAKAVSSPAARQRRDMRQAVARCERIDGIIRREQCRWRTCNGQWGKNGCPSYAPLKLAAD
ncbi:MAG TPA: hypothetical protein VEC06_13515 [Paucimonas sp.]|nr:hypothetical protein [Paucimonas sp.]